MIHAYVVVNVSCCWSTSVACEHTFTLSIVSHVSLTCVDCVTCFIDLCRLCHLCYRLVSIVVHMFCRLVYTFSMLMVESIVQHISRQLVADDSLVAQGTFGVIWCREGIWCKAVHNPMSWKSMHAERAQILAWVSTSFEKFLQQVSQEFGMSICSTFIMIQPVKAFSFGRQLFF